MHSATRHLLAASAISGVLIAASTWLFGCTVSAYDVDGACTLLAGIEGLEIRLRPERAGNYDIVVRSTDGLEAQCPFVVDASLGIEWGTCRVRAGSAQVGFSGPDASALLVRGDAGVPAVVDVELYDASAALILRQRLEPTYTESYPNGPECDPAPTRYAIESLVVPGGEESM